VIEDFPRYWVVTMTTRFTSMQDVQRKAPVELAEHVRRSRELHQMGRLVMAGAFLDEPGRAVRTMGILVSEADAEDFVEHDPFVVADMIERWDIAPWANIFAPPTSAGPTQA
jgi:uncharacterized protein YciI